MSMKPQRRTWSAVLLISAGVPILFLAGRIGGRAYFARTADTVLSIAEPHPAGAFLPSETLFITSSQGDVLLRDIVRRSSLSLFLVYPNPNECAGWEGEALGWKKLWKALSEWGSVQMNVVIGREPSRRLVGVPHVGNVGTLGADTAALRNLLAFRSPTYYLVNSKGRVVFSTFGVRGWGNLIAWLNEEQAYLRDDSRL